MQEIFLYRIYVRGYVQGVGFRWNAAREARQRGLTGFVRNLSDGSVYLEAQGPEEQLKAFVDWCRRGPDFSSVESVETDSSAPVNYTEFRIEH